MRQSNYYLFGLKHKGYNIVVISTNPAQNYKYNQRMIGKNFQGKEGKSFKVERQEELGLNLDMTKFRMYDYALGRFTSIDPLADANPQESWTPYQYAYNNSIWHNDPYGACPECWGFLKGFESTLVGMAESYNPINQVKGVYDQAKGICKDVSEGKGAVEVIGNATGVNQMIDTGKKVLDGDPEAIGKVTATVVAAVATKKLAGKFNTAGTAKVYKYNGTSSNRFGHSKIETSYNRKKLLLLIKLLLAMIYLLQL